ncbi:hypothetical protein SeMB42_g04023 [Synchytrium endobioticum]|uniref:Uncharacterized protein n=1 Tax=Synchytrium endobioticum TaxID=286115 RepID=A0A507D2D7_9FUNG|nr:hypothetical protein SeMB42_g04023 [Synchytrium endobioticum]
MHRVIELPKMNVPASEWTNWIPMHDDTSPKSFISKWDLRNCLEDTWAFNTVSDLRTLTHGLCKFSDKPFVRPRHVFANFVTQRYREDICGLCTF